MKTSSVGRLFDAVASLLGLCDINSYEGEGAILMENVIRDYDSEQLKSYIDDEIGYIVSTSGLWNALYEDYLKGTKKETIILKFLFTLAKVVIDMAVFTGSKKIALSGGVFQNTVLIDMIQELSRYKFELFFNINLAPNDENISYGQVMYYSNLIADRKLSNSKKEKMFHIKQDN